MNKEYIQTMVKVYANRGNCSEHCSREKCPIYNIGNTCCGECPTYSDLKCYVKDPIKYTKCYAFSFAYTYLLGTLHVTELTEENMCEYVI